MTSEPRELALVMSGGGARAAYQAGFLQSLGQRYPNLRIPILTGVSAGAINTAYLANHPGSFREKTEALAQLWLGLTFEQVFRVDPPRLATNVLRWGTRLLVGRASRAIKTRSLLDSSPLQLLLEQVLQPTDQGVLPGIARNLALGDLKAVAITASSYSTRQSITWVQGQQITHWERPHRKSVACMLKLEHILASASLPMFLPAVRIGNCWYGDGAIRLTAPLSPAIHLGANRLLAISTHYKQTLEEADCPDIDGYPPPAQVIGAMFDAMFIDAFDIDALGVKRINNLIAKLPEGSRDGLRPVDLLLQRPSRDLSMLANEYEPELPRAFRYMTRGLGTKETRSNDLLSLLMFQPDYLKRLLALGQEDAEARKDEIGAFLAK